MFTTHAFTGMFATSASTGILILSAVIRWSIVFLLAVAMTRLLRRSSAALRHLVWATALAAGIALPVLQAGGPAWQAGILPRVLAWYQPIESKAQAPGGGGQGSEIKSGANPGSNKIAQPGIQVSAAAPVVDSIRTGGGRLANPTSGNMALLESPTLAIPSTRWWDGMRLDPFMIGILLWFTGFMAVIRRWIAGVASARSVARHASPVTDEGYLELFRNLLATMGVRAGVKLLRSEDPGMPFTFGIFRSCIVLPSDCGSWDLGRRRIVLTHELAHVKRRDCLVQAMAQVTCGLYWINPLVWSAAKKLRIESERACDDWVVTDGTPPSDYAEHLVNIARSTKMSACPEPAALMIARPSQLRSRLESILDPAASRNKTGRVATGTVAVLALLAIAPLAALRPVVRATQASGVSNDERSSVTGLQRNEPSTSSDARKDLSAQPDSANAAASAQIAVDAESQDASDGTGVPQESGSSAGSGGGPTTPNASSQNAPGGTAENQKSADQGGGGEVERQATAALSEALKDPDPNVREEAMRALALSHGPLSTQAIEAALKDSNSNVRENAVWALGLKGGPGASHYLVDALKDRDANVREKAAWGLGLQGDADSISALVGALNDSEALVQAQAAWALGLKGDKRSIEPLIGALKAQDPRVREQAAWALGLKGDSRAIQPSIAALKDSDAQVRRQAAWALGLKGDARAIPGLKDALKDSDQEVRRQAAWALGMQLMNAASADRETDSESEGQTGVALPLPNPLPGPGLNPNPKPFSSGSN
ncbi:MAG TPA: M56 family metallopeptidase [Blastocatellia bacterium]